MMFDILRNDHRANSSQSPAREVVNIFPRAKFLLCFTFDFWSRAGGTWGRSQLLAQGLVLVVLRASCGAGDGNWTYCMSARPHLTERFSASPRVFKTQSQADAIEENISLSLRPPKTLFQS